MSVRRHAVAALVVAVVASTGFAGIAAAQSLGTFTWQLQPFCNKVTVTVAQNGAIYTLDGYDDQCGAPQRAPLGGLATPNPDGTIGLGFHIATSPGGKTVSVESRISLATIGGPWTDSAGNTGTFVLNGAAAGSARPAPVTGPAWGTNLISPVGGGTGLRMKSSRWGPGLVLPAPPAIVVEGDPPSTAGYVGDPAVLSNTSSGDALVGLSTYGNGVVGISEGVLSGRAGVYAASSGGAVALRAHSGNDLPAILAEGGGVSAIRANAGADGSALRLHNGGIRVTGIGGPAFVHTATAANVIGSRTIVDHPLLNGKFDAIVTANYLFSSSIGFLSGGVAVFYDTTSGRWSLMRGDGSAMPPNARFNVIVFNQ